MRRVLLGVFTAGAFVLPSISSAQVAAASVPFPEDFTQQSISMQHRICGDLLAGLSVAGVRELALKGMTLEDLNDETIAIFDTAASSILLMESVRAMNAQERQKAAEIARNIEKRSAKEHIQVALFCRQTVQQWLDTGEVLEQAYEQAILQARNTLPIIVSRHDLKSNTQSNSSNPSRSP